MRNIRELLDLRPGFSRSLTAIATQMRSKSVFHGMGQSDWFGVSACIGISLTLNPWPGNASFATSLQGLRASPKIAGYRLIENGFTDVRPGFLGLKLKSRFGGYNFAVYRMEKRNFSP